MWRPAVGILASTVGLIVVWHLTGPQLWQDFQLRKQPMTWATEARITRAQCTNYFFVVFATCSVDVTRAPNQKERRYYAFLGRAPDQGIRLVRPSHDAGVITADLGLDRIWNRVFAFFTVITALVGLILLGVRRMSAAA